VSGFVHATFNSKCLTPDEQAAWLRSLAVAAEELAEQVEQHHGLTSTVVPIGGRS